jgi:DNA-binding PadR family transcriptional regulator
MALTRAEISKRYRATEKGKAAIQKQIARQNADPYYSHENRKEYKRAWYLKRKAEKQQNNTIQGNYTHLHDINVGLYYTVIV